MLKPTSDAVHGAQRRVGQGRRAVRQLAGRRSRARLLHRERTEEGRTGAEEPAGGRAEPAAAAARVAACRRRSSRSSPTRCLAKGSGNRPGPPVDGGPPVLVTTFRPEAEYPELLAYVAWFDHTRTAIGYYPGRYEPPQRGRPRADDGALRPALAPARHLQRRLHLRRRRKRLERQRPRQRAAEGRQSHAASDTATVASRSSTGAAARTRGRKSRGRARASLRSYGTGASTPS